MITIMEEQKQQIEITQDQALTIQEFDAQIALTEIQLARLQQARYQYLVEQELITNTTSNEDEEATQEAGDAG